MFLPHPPKAVFDCVLVAFLISVCCVVATAAGNEVDLTFNAVPSNDFTSVDIGSLAVQPDGKVIIFRGFQVVNGVPKLKIVRLNSDGTLDNSFNYNASDFNYLTSVVVQNDGKILVGGLSIDSRRRIVRLNSDGSFDGSFISPWTQGSMFNAATVLAVQADGKVLASTHDSGFHISSDTLIRLNSDGSFDGSFTQIYFDGWLAKHYLQDVVVLPGGKLLVGGNHNYGTVFRVNPNGSKDTSFESPLLGSTTSGVPGYASSLALQSDGKVVFTGSFVTVNGINRSGLTRLNSDGTLDLQFPQVTYGGTVRVLSNDKIMIGFHRLNSDGTLDATFNPPSSLLAMGSSQLDGMERLVFFGWIVESGITDYRYARLNTNGSYDLSFNTSVGTAGRLSALALQSDGKVLIAGEFGRLGGVARTTIGRVNADGSVDLSFNAGSGLNNKIWEIVVQTDGKIVVGGGFTTVNSLPQRGVARLNLDGSQDSTYDPLLDGDVSTLALQTDGKVLVGGYFTTVDGVTQKALARLNTDGTLDGTFNPLFGATVTINAVTVQSNGKIMIGGSFSGISGVARSNLARLNSNGTVDTSFNAGSIGGVGVITVQPDGKYLVESGTLKRLNADGSLDNTFQATSISAFELARIRKVLLQADGTVIIGGLFSTVNGVTRSNFARLTPTGQVDGAFFPNGADGEVYALVGQPDGKVLIGGIITAIENIPRAGIARLNTLAYRKNVTFDYDGDGRADVSVYRSSNNYWYLSRSSDSQFTFHYFGASGDIPAPGDYDGDGKSDLGIFRPSTGDWWYKSSVTGVFTGAHFGANGDIPRPSDFDGDGRTDFIIYRPVENNWYRLSSGTSQWSQRYFGSAGDKPVVGDFDGDGKSDPAIFRPSTATFWYMSSIDSAHRAIRWGASSDIPTPADFDGDGKTDAAVYRPSTGYWYILFSGTGTYSSIPFGVSEDKPVPADYDGDGKADVAVYRPSTGTWYMLRSSAGFNAQQFGNSTDIPTPNMFVP